MLYKKGGLVWKKENEIEKIWRRYGRKERERKETVNEEKVEVK